VIGVLRELCRTDEAAAAQLAQILEKSLLCGKRFRGRKVAGERKKRESAKDCGQVETGSGGRFQKRMDNPCGVLALSFSRSVRARSFLPSDFCPLTSDRFDLQSWWS